MVNELSCGHVVDSDIKKVFLGIPRMVNMNRKSIRYGVYCNKCAAAVEPVDPESLETWLLQPKQQSNT